MTISVRCFASLSDELGFSQIDLDHIDSQTIEDIWNNVAKCPPPKNLLCALNHEYTDFSQRINDGDEVAFFPPVTGG